MSFANSNDENFEWLLSSPYIEELMATTFQDILVMQETALNIARQPQVELDLVPTLPITQALAQDHAQNYQKIYFPKYCYIYAQVQAYNNTIQEFTKTLLPYAEALDKGSDTESNDATQFRRGLRIIEHYLSTNKDTTAKTLLDLQIYSQLINDDYVRYTTDVKTAEEKISGPRGEITVLQQDLAALSQSLEDTNRRVAAGATKDLLKAAEMGIKAGTSLVDIPEIGSVVVDTVFSYAEEAIGSDSDALEESKKITEDYGKKLLLLVNEKAQMGVLTTLQLNVVRFYKSLQSAYSTTELLQSAWKDLIDRADILSSYKKSQSEAFFTNQLLNAQEYWTDASKKAIQYEKTIRNIG